MTRFARGCWGNGDRMGHLVDDGGTVIEEDCDQVPLLRRKLFGDSSPQLVRYERGREEDWSNAGKTLWRLLSTTNNRSAPGPDRVTWRLLKLVMRTALGRHLTQ